MSSDNSGARDAIVDILDFIDNTAADRLSLEALKTRTIASSRPDWIDNA